MTDPASGVGLLAALAAGTVSFLSPCVLPLVPGYLSTVVGVAPGDLEQAGTRRVLLPSLAFVGSFSLIFILLGLGATTVGSALRSQHDTLDKISGALIVGLGAYFVLTSFVTRLNHQWHVEALLSRAGKGGPVVAGAAFAVAWTPCVGPTLGAILSAAALTQSVGHAAILLGFYSAGLAIPFLATAVAFNRMTSAFDRIKRHFPIVIGAGGVILIAMGTLVWTGELFQLNIKAQNLLESLGINFFNSV